MPEPIIPDGQLGEPQLSPSNPDGTAPVAPDQSNLSLEDLNKLLGKSFPTKEAALKSVKDTFSYVGKKTDDIKKEVIAELNADQRTDTLAKELAAMRVERFYDKNPEYADPAIRKVIDRIGGNPQDVVSSEEFKTIFNKVSEFDKSAKLKTVLESNPRLAVSRDNLQKARETQDAAFKTGVFQGQAREEVERLAVNAVKEAYQM